MSPCRSTPTVKQRSELKKQLYQKIKILVLTLEALPTQHTLYESDQKQLGIHASDFSAEKDDPWYPSLGPRFFTPLPHDSLPISPCDLSLYKPDDHDKHPMVWPIEPHELRNDWMDGRELADHIERHLRKADEQIRPMWKRTSPPLHRLVRNRGGRGLGDHYYMVSSISSSSSIKRPHQIIFMVSDHPGEEDSILRSEVLVMAGYMRLGLHKSVKENTLVVPVMIISVTNLLKVRVLQGHFDGTLHIRRSKLHDFCVDDHEDVMKRIICWLKSTPHGDTTLSETIPLPSSIIGDADEDEASDSSTTAEVPTTPCPDQLVSYVQ